MAVNISIYSNANTSTRSVTVDFVGDVLAEDTANAASWTADYEYYFKLTTGAQQDNNQSYPAKIVRALSDLALNGQKQSASNVGTDYADVHSMIVDYTYDYIYGHTADQYASGVTEQRPMKF